MSRWIHVDQGIFTSLEREGQTGYHIVSCSRGLTDDEASAITQWSPAHDALEADERNRASLQLFPVSQDRYALARTCAGPPEYSGRGGPQLYTHLILFDPRALGVFDDRLVSLYRSALALGLWCYRADPPRRLEQAALPQPHARSVPLDFKAWAYDLGLVDPEPLLERLARGKPVHLTSGADRIELLECLLGMLPQRGVGRLSCGTSLKPSRCRPYQLLITRGEAR